MEEVVAAARRVERILQERPTSGMDTFIESMNCQIQFLAKDLAKAQDKIAAQPPVATPTAAPAVPPSQAVAAAQHPPASLAPPQMAHPAATQLPPPYSPVPSQYFSGDNGTPYFRGQRRRLDRGPLQCFRVARKATQRTAVPPELCCSACCGKRSQNPPESHPGSRSWQGRPSPR